MPDSDVVEEVGKLVPAIAQLVLGGGDDVIDDQVLENQGARTGTIHTIDANGDSPIRTIGHQFGHMNETPPAVKLKTQSSKSLGRGNKSLARGSHSLSPSRFHSSSQNLDDVSVSDADSDKDSDADMKNANGTHLEVVEEVKNDMESPTKENDIDSPQKTRIQTPNKEVEKKQQKEEQRENLAPKLQKPNPFRPKVREMTIKGTD
jgi:hypothetical protein